MNVTAAEQVIAATYRAACVREADAACICRNNLCARRLEADRRALAATKEA